MATQTVRALAAFLKHIELESETDASKTPIPNNKHHALKALSAIAGP